MHSLTCQCRLQLWSVLVNIMAWSSNFDAFPVTCDYFFHLYYKIAIAYRIPPTHIISKTFIYIIQIYIYPLINRESYKYPLRGDDTIYIRWRLLDTSCIETNQLPQSAIIKPVPTISVLHIFSLVKRAAILSSHHLSV